MKKDRYFMMWQHRKDKDPFEYFRKKYGEPTAFATGNGVKIIPPDGVEELEIKIPDGQVWVGYVSPNDSELVVEDY